MTDPYIPPLTFPLRITEAHPTPHPRSDLWDANGMFIANISTAWAVQIREATVGGVKSQVEDAAIKELSRIFMLRVATAQGLDASYFEYDVRGWLNKYGLSPEPAAEPTFPQRLRELARKWGDKNETNLAKMLREAAGMIEGESSR